jgi:D-inositol-3-phosphate glycosyltransferase
MPQSINERKGRIKIALLTAGKDPHYALGLLSGLVDQKIHIDFIGNDEMQKDEIVRRQNVTYYNLRGNQDPLVPISTKVSRVLKYYLKLLNYAAQNDSHLFHILWLNKFFFFDGIFVNAYYKLLGKKLVFTAHNINIRERDENDHLLNRLFLIFMYRLFDHIFVHTEKMKLQLIEDYGVSQDKISTIPFGINNIIPKSDLTKAAARKNLQLSDKDKIILFFGNIAPYKGLEYLVEAFIHVRKQIEGVKLIIAGQIKNCEPYWKQVQNVIKDHDLGEHIVERIEYIPDNEVEIYFKSADLLVLPYRHIFQSGVAFLAYSFGLPVVATDVGSLREEIIEGTTGYLCRPDDPVDLADTINAYFDSDLFSNLDVARDKIVKYANETYSWENIGRVTYCIYNKLLSRNSIGKFEKNIDLL